MKSEFGNNFSRMLRSGVKLTPFEVCALKSCIQVLPDELSKVILDQLDQYNLVQREVDWRALNFYCMSGFRSIRDVQPLLPLKSDDVSLVKVALLTSCGKTINTVLHAVNGRLFSINFGISTKLFENETEIKITKVTESWLSVVKNV